MTFPQIDPKRSKPAAHRSFSRILALLTAATLLTSCQKDKKVEEEGPTEPWLKGDPADNEEAQKLTLLQIQSGQSLRFNLPTRRSKPGGSLHGLTGELRLNLRKLESASGEIIVDLSQLEFSIPPLEIKMNKEKKRVRKVDVKEGKVDASHAPAEVDWKDIDWSAEARRWLKLGSEITEKNRASASHARYSFTSFRNLSHTDAKNGVRKKSKTDPKTEVREVRATAVGELTLGGLSVHREIPLRLRFSFDPTSSEGPSLQEVEVELRGSLRVPLSEYKIEPRDEAGHSESQKRRFVGKVVGSTVRISGVLTLSPTP